MQIIFQLKYRYKMEKSNNNEQNQSSQKQQEEIIWEKASKSKSITEIEDFLDYYPNSQYKEKAEELIKQIEIAGAKGKKRKYVVFGILGILLLVLVFVFINLFKEKEPDLYSKINAEKDIEQINKYIAKYPKGEHIVEVKYLFIADKYQKALNENTKEALEAFIAEFPEAKELEDAKRKVLMWDVLVNSELYLIDQKIAQTYTPIKTKGGKWGIVDKKFEFVVSPIYDSINNFSDGLACFQKVGKYGYLTIDGKEVITPSFDLAKDFTNGLAAVAKNQNGKIKWGFIDKTGQQVVDYIYDTVLSCNNGVIPVANYDKNNNLSYQIINMVGQPVIPEQFQEIKNFNFGLAFFRKNQKWGLIDSSGTILYSDKWDYVLHFKEGFATVGSILNGQLFVGVLNINAEQVVDYSENYQYISSFENGYAVASKDGENFGIIKPDGTKITDFIYSEIGALSEGLIPVKDNSTKKWGYLDENGQMKIDFIYDETYGFHDGLAVVGIKKGRDLQFGYINKLNEIQIDYQFLEAGNFSNGIAKAKNTDNESFYINRYGKKIDFIK